MFMTRLLITTLLLLSLAGCGSPYGDGQYAWWAKMFVKKITVLVYDHDTYATHIAGQFIPDFSNAFRSWETAQRIANNYANLNQIRNWEYKVCGKTFWSECIQGL